jgi:hypothetical protein
MSLAVAREIAIAAGRLIKSKDCTLGLVGDPLTVAGIGNLAHSNAITCSCKIVD